MPTIPPIIDTTATTPPPITEVLAPDKWGHIDYKGLLSDWLEKGINFGVRVLIAIIIFYVGRLVVKWLLRIADRAMERRNFEVAVRGFLHSILKVILLIAVVVAAINSLGVAPVSFAALMAAAGVTIGASLGGQLQNLAGGVIILLTHPFRVGDYISTGTTEGIVSRVAIFFTTLTTGDNKSIYIPNAKITSDALINYTEMKLRRCEWLVTVDYDTDYEQVRALLEQIANNESRILPEPEHQVALSKLSSSSVDIFLRGWCHTEEYWQLYWDLNREIYTRFNKEGIGFAFPQLRIHTS